MHEPWYACYTRARHEKRVAGHLQDRGFEVFLPIIPEERQWHDRKRVVEFPMFPGYVFSRFSLKSLHTIVDTPGVATVVSFQGEPAQISDEEIENVRRLAEAIARSGSLPERAPIPRVQEGDRVRVRHGPFKDVEGRVVERRGADRALLQVGIPTIGQALKIEVDLASLHSLAS